MRKNFYGMGRPRDDAGWAPRRVIRRVVSGLALYLVAAGCDAWAAQADQSTSPTAPGVTVLKGSADSVTVPPSAPGVTVLKTAPDPALILHTGHDGHVAVDALVNGTPIRMVFDTGASVVSLTQADAERIGITKNLSYTVPFGTANGTSYGAPVTLRVRIGQHEIDDVKAVVMQNLNISLLGQSFLSRLHSYEMRDSVLTLTW